MRKNVHKKLTAEEDDDALAVAVVRASGAKPFTDVAAIAIAIIIAVSCIMMIGALLRDFALLPKDMLQLWWSQYTFFIHRHPSMHHTTRNKMFL